MPVVFAQPTAASSFRDISSGGNIPAYLSAVASMSNALQGRYAQEAESNAREGLGYANLRADTMMRGRALGLQETEMMMRPALQAQALQMRAQLEMDQWVQQRQFNARDQEELTRQQNVMAELQEKYDKGEISSDEYYSNIAQKAPRVNSLEMKFQATRQKAMDQEIQRGQMLNKLTQQQIADSEAFQAARTNNAFGWEVDSGSVGDLTQKVVSENPALAMNPAALVAEVEKESRRQGKGHRWYQTKNGREIHPEDKARIDSQIKAQEQKAQNEVKQRENRSKLIGDFISNRMKPDTLGATPDFATVQQEAEKYADLVYRMSLSPDERKEYDSQQERQAKMIERAKADGMDFEKRLAQVINQPNTPVTEGYSSDLKWLVEFHQRHPGGPAFLKGQPELQSEYNARVNRVKQAEALGAGKAPQIPKSEKLQKIMSNLFRSGVRQSLPQPAYEDMAEGFPLG